MIQLAVLNGTMAGQSRVARHFPFQIGRAADCELAVPGEGVWDRHASIAFQAGEGFLLESSRGALVSVNGERVTQVRLRNGDLIECGSVKLRFWLGPLPQKGLRLREAFTWLGLAALLALQLALIYWLVA